MDKRKAAKPARESGQALVESVLVVMATLVIACAALDVGKYALAFSAADQAATEAARVVALHDGDDATVRAKAADAAHAASPNAGTMAVTLTPATADETATYGHKLYNRASGAFDERTGSQVQSRAWEVSVSLESDWLTPFGRGLAALAGGSPDGKFTVSVEKSALEDETLDGAEAGTW